MDEADVKSEQHRHCQSSLLSIFWKDEDGGLAPLSLIEREVAFMRCRGAKVVDAQDLHLG